MESGEPLPAPGRRGLLLTMLLAMGMLSSFSPLAAATTVDPGAHSFQAINYTDRSMAIASSLGVLAQVSGGSSAQSKSDATLTATPGLATGPTNCLSFQAANGMWLRHKDFRIQLMPNDGTETFHQDATFCIRDGTVVGSVRLESYNYPGRFVRHRNFQLWVDADSAVAPFPSDSSFTVISPWTPSVRKNPVIKGLFADPNVINFDGRYYVYPTSDGYAGWGGTRFRAFSSADLINWTDNGTILTLGTDVTWAASRAWAPTIARKNERYYFYFCADTNIGVAVSGSPTGPFTDALGHALVAKGAHPGQMIDPDVFTDTDGQSYLVWGNGYGYMAKLNDDMVSLAGPVQTLSLPNFREGLFMHQRAGVYYLSYSVDDTGSENYHVDYATAASPQGPWTYRGTLLQKNLALGVKGPGHHSIVQQPGTDNWFIVYHRFAVPLGDGTNRETAVDSLKYNGDGTLQPVVVTP